MYVYIYMCIYIYICLLITKNICAYILYINICSLNPKPHCLNHVPFHGEAAETTLSCRLPKVRRPDRAVLIVYGLDVRRLTCQTLPNP